MAEVSLNGVWKIYEGGVEAVREVTVHIPDGAFCVLVGPSGCGKSTSLRMIAGLEEVSRGEITIGGRVVNDVAPKDRDIAMVFQNYALYPHMTVEKNLSFALRLRKTPKDEIRRRVDEAARMLGLTEYLQRKPGALSGGQRQRVALGRAMVREPSAFLFDEPLSNLDAKLRVQMRLEIRKLQQKLGVTSIYVTHDQVEAMTLGDRLMVLNGGYVEQFGTPIELYDAPQSMFVAGFIGSPAMNFLPATVSGGAVTLANGASLPGGQGQGEVVMGVRPEHLTTHSEGPIQIQVEFVEVLGANTLLHGVLADTDTEMVVSLPGHVSVTPGAILKFQAAAGDLHFFAPDTQKRI